MDRRHFLRVTAAAGAVAAFDAVAVACGDDRPTANTRVSTTTDAGRVVPATTQSPSTTGAPSTTEATATTEALPEVTRYGPLADTPDENGLLLPAGFTSRLLAVGGEMVPGTGYRWHPFPDGGACFALDDGGWVYVNNSEVWVEGEGGAGALRFDAAGQVVDAYRVLDGTTMNCSGGATPWGTWLSCEETTTGQVWECDPLGQQPAQARPAMGMFRHEMVAADAERAVLYLSEDEPDGLLYRFRPRIWGDLSEGDLHALAVAGDGSTRWVKVQGLGEPGRTKTRHAAPEATPLPGCEGVALDGDVLYLATKGDERVSRLDLVASRLTLYWEGPPLSGPDNLLVQPGTGNVFVCEDGGDMELVMLTPDGHADAFLRFVGHDGSEVTGAAFDPSGTRLIVSSQRAPTPTTFGQLFAGEPDWPLGGTYMISGPF